ncbi:PepSY domain-containing protein [Thalassotalea sp. 1_MG-2023]|uniref:PepSY domain-containing protein n=1 Tax=Thalassotalea sp. 1_MG-2023 TaxID=3062680 RepID=UPI0026E16712|nr:PepSY domain-containing protein [Thalassotalea sp. 1_MG-2023]MDO6428278.1 PepSY domain-containing protein [Thalassotalea sp. 1_MG-2023]
MNFCTVVRSIILIVMLFSLNSYTPVYAQPLEAGKTYRVANAQQAARLVKARIGGKILKVQRTNVKGNLGYRVKVLTNKGHVVSVKVDAVSGKIVGN